MTWDLVLVLWKVESILGTIGTPIILWVMAIALLSLFLNFHK